MEGPVPNDAVREPKATLRDVPGYPNVTVLQMQFPASRLHEGDWVDAERRRLVQGVLDGPFGQEYRDPVQWFYDPMAVTAFAGQINEIAIVYDCMDELSRAAQKSTAPKRPTIPTVIPTAAEWTNGISAWRATEAR